MEVIIMTWDYAELSKLAKENGGPEKLIEQLIESGVETGTKKTLPWVGVALAGGVALTLGVQKLVEHFKSKKSLSEEEIQLAKEELIQGIKEYDAIHNNLDIENDLPVE